METDTCHPGTGPELQARGLSPLGKRGGQGDETQGETLLGSLDSLSPLGGPGGQAQAMPWEPRSSPSGLGQGAGLSLLVTEQWHHQRASPASTAGAPRAATAAGDSRGHTHTHARVRTPARTSICRMASSRSRMASRSSSVISGSSACPWACHMPSPPLKIFSSSDSSANGAWGLCRDTGRDTDQGYPHAQPAATRLSSRQAPRSQPPACSPEGAGGRTPPCHSRDVPTGSRVLGLP